MKAGISLYFGSGLEENERIIERAMAAGATHAFTSLHIPEEHGVDYARDAKRLLHRLRDAGIGLIVDVGPETCAKLGCTRIEELRDLGFTHLRLDYGFSIEQTVELSRRFRIVFNASTVTRDEISAWRAAGADLSRFSACHNYYPKRYTGLDIETVRASNELLSAQGFETIAFVPGDGRFRGPLYEGLPTVERHRERTGDLAFNMLELAHAAGTDVVLVGDPDLTDGSWGRFGQICAGYIDVRCTIRPEYSFLIGQIHHDRPDSSSLVFRSQESRTSLRPPAVPVDETASAYRPAGSIAISNDRYLRYEGELEVARVDLRGDERMNVIGEVSPCDRGYLSVVRNGFGLRFIE